MFKIDKIKKEIHLTRGDVACINVTTKINKDGVKVPYEFKVGDVVRIKIVKKNDYSQVVFTKDVVVTEPGLKVMIPLTGEETKIGDIILKKEVTYWYEIELNPDTNPQTIIGHDKETGAKLFILYPEGGNK